MISLDLCFVCSHKMQYIEMIAIEEWNNNNKKNVQKKPNVQIKQIKTQKKKLYTHLMPLNFVDPLKIDGMSTRHKAYSFAQYNIRLHTIVHFNNNDNSTLWFALSLSFLSFSFIKKARDAKAVTVCPIFICFDCVSMQLFA